MKEKDFEQLVKSKLDNFEMDIPDQLWKGIEKQLSSPKVVSKPIYPYISGIAALLIGALFLIRYLHTETDVIPTANIDLSPIASTQLSQTKAQNPTTPLLAEAILPVVSNNRQKEMLSPTLYTETIKNKTAEIETPVQHQPSLSEGAPVQKKETPRENGQTRWIRKHTFETETVKSPETRYRRRQNGISVSLLASNITSDQNSTSSPYHVRNQSKAFTLLSSSIDMQDELTYTHNMPLSFGMTIEKRILPNLGIETGLIYSYLRSSYKSKTGQIEGNQHLHYLGIPVHLLYHIAEWGKIRIYAGIGSQVDFNVSGKRSDKIRSKGSLQSNNLPISADNTASITDKVQWSVNCKAGLSYPLISMLHLYAEPTFAYHFQNGSSVENIWKVKPANFALTIGLKASF